MDVSGGKDVFFAGFNIYEDILNPFGPVAEIRVIDPTDALGQNNITGSFSEDVEIKFSPDSNLGGGETSVKLKMYQNKNVNNLSSNNRGSNKHKQYDIRCVSPEVLNAQGNYIQKSFKEKKTSDMVKHVLEKGFKSKRQMDIGSTEPLRDMRFNNEHPLDVLKKLNNEHVSQKYESSCFALFQQSDDNGGEHKYVFKTFEELFEQESVVTLTQSTNLNYEAGNDQEKQNSIIWFKPSDNFFTGPRAFTKSKANVIDLTTHKVVSADGEKTNFKWADKSEIYKNKADNADGVNQDYIVDKANSGKQHNTAAAKVKRAEFLAGLAQTGAKLEVYYNPKIKLGSMIKLEIPKAHNSEGGLESQFNGKVLVVGIRTKYKVSRDPPNCTMELTVAKGNSFKEGGGQDA
jgi:hypothetical protein